jgi:hypothetical protein
MSAEVNEVTWAVVSAETALVDRPGNAVGFRYVRLVRYDAFEDSVTTSEELKAPTWLLVSADRSEDVSAEMSAGAKLLIIVVDKLATCVGLKLEIKDVIVYSPILINSGRYGHPTAL